VGDTRGQQPVWSSHDGVVDDDARCAISEIELPHPGAQAIGIAGIGGDGVDRGTGVGQGAREVAEAVRAARHQGYPVAAHGEATGHGHSKARPRADQQKVAAIDGAGTCGSGEVSGRAFPAARITCSLVRHGCRSFRVDRLGEGLGLVALPGP